MSLLSHARPVRTLLIVLALATLGALGAVSSAAAASGPVYVTSGGTGTCASNSPSNGLPTLDGALACVPAQGDTIDVGPGQFGTVGSATAVIEVSKDVSIVGAGPGVTELVNTVLVDPGVTASVSGLTVDTGVGNGVETGVANEGTLTVRGSVIKGNLGDVSAPFYGASGIVNVTQSPGSSSGPDYSPVLTVLDSTISGNVDQGTGVGGVLLGNPQSGYTDTATIVNSTISGNAAPSAVGGVEAQGATLTIRDSTIADNHGPIAGGLLDSGAVAVELGNTIVADNTSGTGSGASPSDCVTQGSGNVVVQDGVGHNLIGDGTGCAGPLNGVNGDQVGTSSAPVDPLLGSLAANGGPTQTQALLAGSPAIGGGDPGDCQAVPVSDQDQRGMARNSATRGACDIGAYDTGGPTHTLTVSVSGSGTGAVSSSPAGLDCATTCAHSYPANSLVTLTALPATGSTFSGWSGGGCSGTGSCTVRMSADEPVSASFVASPSPGTGSGSGTGTGSGSGSGTGAGPGSGTGTGTGAGNGTGTATGTVGTRASAHLDLGKLTVRRVRVNCPRASKKSRRAHPRAAKCTALRVTASVTLDRRAGGSRLTISLRDRVGRRTTQIIRRVKVTSGRIQIGILLPPATRGRTRWTVSLSFPGNRALLAGTARGAFRT